MTSDEIRAELIECLWNARRTYEHDLGVTFEAYWWSIWLHRKADLIKYSLRAKRDIRRESLQDAAWFVEVEDPTPPAEWPVEVVEKIPEPPTDDPDARRVWCLLAVGASRQDVLTIMDLPKRRYYQIIHSWRRPEIREELEA